MRAFIWGMIISHSFGCVGQNVYNSGTIYYNMDTLRCVDKDVRFWDGDKLNPKAGNPDSIGLYCTTRIKIDVPVVTATDDNLNLWLDSCLVDASKSDYLQFPDSSGYFVELLLFDKKEDSSYLGISATPYSNYYMGMILPGWQDEVVYEFYGHPEKVLHGCFFINDILFVVTSYWGMDYGKAACLFPPSQSSLQLVLFTPVVIKITNSAQSSHEYFFIPCDAVPETTEVDESAVADNSHRNTFCRWLYLTDLSNDTLHFNFDKLEDFGPVHLSDDELNQIYCEIKRGNIDAYPLLFDHYFYSYPSFNIPKTEIDRLICITDYLALKYDYHQGYLMCGNLIFDNLKSRDNPYYATVLIRFYENYFAFSQSKNIAQKLYEIYCGTYSFQDKDPVKAAYYETFISDN